MDVGGIPSLSPRYRCYNGELFAQGTRQEHPVGRAHPGDVVTLTVNTVASSLSLAVNDVSYGTVFEAVPSQVHFCVLFYNCQPPQRSVRLLSASHKTEFADPVPRESVSLDGQADRMKEAESFIRSLVRYSV